ncbi:type I-F CRISPR-associated protein Csy1 [Selenomonas ruminis]|uniref:type I-F CRISPR-associated protein Csy1 n=1 Tax=Selenomonas ruminis TaxID=2593411 RepID=UPI0016561493|nr:type I-F CRISPR-associated protein Csy1 [Selenomonas sp. mPRGC5]
MSVFSDYVQSEADRKNKTKKEWLLDIAKNADKCLLATHIGRFTNPDVTVNWQADIKDKPAEGYVSTSSVSCNNDVFVAANYLATASLLQQKLEDGKTVYEHLQADDDYLKQDIADIGVDYVAVRNALLEVKTHEKPTATDTRLKQVYFPVGDGYHLLTVLPPSSLMQEVRLRIRAMEDNARQACDKKSEKYGNVHERIYNLTQMKFGGTKPQNISFNNNRLGGRCYMLPSLPPTVVGRSIAYPRKDFFRDTLRLGDFRYLFLQLHSCYIDKRNNLVIRQKIRGVEQTIMDRVMQSVYVLRQKDCGWSDSRSLGKAQTIWLDDKYKKERHEEDSWQSDVVKDFLAWLMSTYEWILKRDKILLGDGELKALSREIYVLVKEDLQKQW